MNNFLQLPYILRDIPFFNKAAIIPINFVAITLLIMVLNHKKSKDTRSNIFVFMAVFMLLWVDFAYLARLFGLYDDLSEFFLRIAWFATPLLFYCVYLTSVYVIGQEVKYKKVSIGLLFLAIFLSSATAFTDFVISGVKFTNNTLDIIYGIGLYPFLILILVFIGFTLIPLIKTKINTNAKIFLTGVIIFYIANAIFNISLPIFFNITHLYYFGDYSTTFLLSFTTYAILRHELFDIKTFATEVFTIVILSVLFSKLFFTQSTIETLVDLFIFVSMVVFGVLLIRSVNTEIEERKKLQFLTLQLQELDQRKDEFLSIAAHELRAPMTAIKGYVSMILEGDAGLITDETKEYLRETLVGNDRLIRLVNNMLNISRIEEGRYTYEMGNVNLSKALSTVFNEYRGTAEEKGLKYTLTIQPGIVDTVYVDIDRIYEVLANFISNSIKYTDKGSVTVRLLQTYPTTIHFEVEDSGEGISEENQKKIFQKFYRVDSKIVRTVGTGLGLYISKLLIEKFGGRIGFKSEVGKGSIFWFELPIKLS